jgi:hypothetical protein
MPLSMREQIVMLRAAWVVRLMMMTMTMMMMMMMMMILTHDGAQIAVMSTSATLRMVELPQNRASSTKRERSRNVPLSSI